MNVYPRNRIVWIIRGTPRMIGTLGVAVLLAVVGLQTIDILGRWLFSAPQPWVADIREMSLPVAIAALFCLTLAERGMIAIEFIGGFLGETATRLLNIIGALALLGLFLIIAMQMQTFAHDAIKTGRTSFNLGISMAPTWLLVSVLFWLCVLVQAAMTILVALDLAASDSHDKV